MIRQDAYQRLPDVAPEESCATGLAIFPVTKPSGKCWGIGLLLANATVERRDGGILLLNRPESGSRTRVTLPLSALRARVAGCAPKSKRLGVLPDGAIIFDLN